MPKTTTEVLGHRQIIDRINRVAWQIYENHSDETEIILAGIADHGYKLAELLAGKLRSISPLKIILLKVRVNKRDPLASPAKIEDNIDLEHKCVIVVDDVLNTGSTLIYGIRYFLDYKVKQIKTVVLVDRSHKSFPVKADFKGLSLSTNMMEHVQVQIDQEPFAVTVS